MARKKAVMFLGQSNKEGLGTWDEVSAADFLRLTGVAKPGTGAAAYTNFKRVIPGYKVWTPKLPETGKAISASALAPDVNTITATCLQAVAANEFKDRWVICDSGGNLGLARKIKTNTAAAVPGTQFTVTVQDDRPWLVLPNSPDTFNVTQGGTQGAGADWRTNPAAAFVYEGRFQDLQISYKTLGTWTYADGYDYCNYHGMPITTPALSLSLQYAGSMPEHMYRLKREIAPNEDLYVVMMPLAYSFLAPRFDILSSVDQISWAWCSTERTNDWSPFSAQASDPPCRYDLLMILLETVLTQQVSAWFAANSPGDTLDIQHISICLGESSSLFYYMAIQAGADMTRLRDTIRAALVAKNLTTLPANRIPFTLNGMDWVGYPGGHIVNPQYEALAAADPYSGYVSTLDVPVRTGIDLLHFTGQGYITIGQREVVSWREILKRAGRLGTKYASLFEAVRPAWGIDWGGGKRGITADPDYFDALAETRRMWPVAYMLQRPEAGRIPVYSGTDRTQIRNSQADSSGFKSEELLGYAFTDQREGATPVSVGLGVSQMSFSAKYLARSDGAGTAPSVVGSCYHVGSGGQYDEKDVSYAMASGDKAQLTLSGADAFNVGRMRITIPGYLADYDILLRGASPGFGFRVGELIEENIGTNTYRRHEPSADYRNPIQHGTRDFLGRISRGVRVGDTAFMARWMPMDYGGDGMRDMSYTRFERNHSAMIHEGVLWSGATHGINVVPHALGLAHVYQLTPIWNNPAFPADFIDRYGCYLKIHLMRLFDKAYMCDPSTGTMTDLGWSPVSNHDWYVDSQNLVEQNNGVFVSQTPRATQQWGCLVWRATGTLFGSNTDLAVALFAKMQGAPGNNLLPARIAISSYTDGTPDNGSFGPHDQANGYSLLEIGCPISRKLNAFAAWTCYMVVGRFSTIGATIQTLWQKGLDAYPTTDVSIAL